MTISAGSERLSSTRLVWQLLGCAIKLSHHVLQLATTKQKELRLLQELRQLHGADLKLTTGSQSRSSSVRACCRCARWS
jgi:hypothetical protein